MPSFNDLVLETRRVWIIPPNTPYPENHPRAGEIMEPMWVDYKPGSMSADLMVQMDSALNSKLSSHDAARFIVRMVADWNLDEEYTEPVMEDVEEIVRNADGTPVRADLLDEDGRVVLDDEGNPRKGDVVRHVVTRQKVDHEGNLVYELRRRKVPITMPDVRRQAIEGLTSVLLDLFVDMNMIRSKAATENDSKAEPTVSDPMLQIRFRNRMEHQAQESGSEAKEPQRRSVSGKPSLQPLQTPSKPRRTKKTTQPAQ